MQPSAAQVDQQPGPPCVGHGHLYQGRFKSFLVEDGEHLWAACRYVERNALRGGLGRRAEDWRWSSLWRREKGDEQTRSLLAAWPIRVPEDWLRRVNRAQTAKRLSRLRRCANRGQPYGGQTWVDRMVKRFSLECLFRPQGRPRNNRPRNGS